MTFELPLDSLKFYHDWVLAPLGSLLRVSTENGDVSIGVRCQHNDSGRTMPLVFIPEPPQAHLLQSGDLRSGAVDVSGSFELTAVDPVVQRYEHEHNKLFGCILSIGTGELYTRGRLGGHIGYVRLNGPADQIWQVNFEGIPNARIAGVIGIRPKAALMRQV